MGDTISCVADDSADGNVTFSEMGEDLVFSFGSCISGDDEHDEMTRGQFVQLASTEQVPKYMDKSDIEGTGGLE
jgi:hypothetical protein